MALGSTSGQDFPVQPSASRPNPNPLEGLESPVAVVSGVGPDRRQLLERLGIHSVRDLLWHAPRRHEDRRRFSPIRDLALTDTVTVRGKVVAAGVNRFRSGKSVFQLIVDDGTGRLHCAGGIFRFWSGCLP